MNLSHKTVFWGSCAVLFLIPLPYGSVDEWAVFVFQAGVFLLFGIFAVGESRLSRHEGQPLAGRSSRALPASPESEPVRRVAAAMLALFFGIMILQLLPLPLSLLRAVSPGTAALYDWSGLAEAGKKFFTLSFVPAATRSELVKYAAYCLFGFLLWKTVRTRRQVESLVLVLLAAGLFQAVYGMAEYFGGTGRIFGYENAAGKGSAFGTFINRDHFAGFLEMTFPVALGYLLAKADFFALKKGLTFRQKLVWFGQERLQKVIVIAVVTVVMGAGLFFSRSRSGVLILLITFFLMMTAISLGSESSSRAMHEIRHQQRRPGKIVRTTGLALAFTLITIGIKPVIQRFTADSLLKERRPVFYGLTLEMIRDYPLFGTGAGTYRHAYTKYESEDLHGILHHAHNDYLETVAETGLVAGGAAILTALLALGWMFGRWLRRSDGFVRGVGLGCAAGAAAMLIHSLSDFNLRTPANAVYLVALYVLGMRTVTLKRGTEREMQKQEPVKKRKLWTAAFAVLFLFILAAAEYLGWHRYTRYERERAGVRSIEAGFPRLEASLKRAVRFSGRTAFREELVRLYLEMALAENEFGTPAGRASYLERAEEAAREWIRHNPVDARAYYEMGKIYLLYNFPLLTYAEKGRDYLRKAVELKPADEFLNLNVLYIFMTQWDSLEEEERKFVHAQWRLSTKNSTAFEDEMRDRWRENFGGTAGIDAILQRLQEGSI